MICSRISSGELNVVAEPSCESERTPLASKAISRARCSYNVSVAMRDRITTQPPHRNPVNWLLQFQVHIRIRGRFCIVRMFDILLAVNSLPCMAFHLAQFRIPRLGFFPYIAFFLLSHMRDIDLRRSSQLHALLSLTRSAGRFFVSVPLRFPR